jgi:hypothetical protein
MADPDKGDGPRDRVQDALLELAYRKQRLDFADDQLRDQIPEIEKALAQLKLGVSISTRMNEDHETGESEDLMFSKWGANWRLTVCLSTPYSPDEWGLLVDTSRETRANAFEVLPKLILDAVGQMDNKIKAREALLTQNRELLSTLEAFSSSGDKPETKAEPKPKPATTSKAGQPPKPYHGVNIVEAPTKPRGGQ